MIHAAKLWAETRRQPLLTAAVILLAVSAVFSAAAGRLAYEAQHDLREVVDDSTARQCVNAHQARREIRDAIPIPGEAIIEVATDADPERVEQFRAVVDRRIHEAFPAPDCDIDAARRQLAR